MTSTPTVIIPRSAIRKFLKATSNLEELFITEKHKNYINVTNHFLRQTFQDELGKQSWVQVRFQGARKGKVIHHYIKQSSQTLN